MKRYFYAHVVSPEDIHKELEILDITEDEKHHLAIVIESTLHHVVVDVILSEVPEEHKDTLLRHISQDDHDQIWEVLHAHFDDPEGRVKEVAHEVLQELRDDIAATKGVTSSN